MCLEKRPGSGPKSALFLIFAMAGTFARQVRTSIDFVELRALQNSSKIFDVRAHAYSEGGSAIPTLIRNDRLRKFGPEPRTVSLNCISYICNSSDYTNEIVGNRSRIPESFEMPKSH